MSDFFSHVSLAPPDPILGLMSTFHADPRKDKINLSVGVYQTEDQKTPVLSCVKEAESILLNKEVTKNYLPIGGDAEFLRLVGERVFGSPLYQKISQRLCSMQSLGGTGGLRLGGEFFKEEIGQAIYIPSPSWPNHRGVFSQCGLKVHTYPYYDTKTKGIAFSEMIHALDALPKQSLVAFHACCHNPSGADLDKEQWERVCDLCIQKELIVFFDAAYLGFDLGFEQDAWAVRLFAERNVEFLLSVSFSKNFSLYAERIGAFFIHAKEASVEPVMSKLKIVARRNYSNPPLHGAEIIKEILCSHSLAEKWEIELADMRQRIANMRHAFVTTLCAHSQKQDYSYLIDKRGLFSFLDLTEEQVLELRKEYGIYMTLDGRVNVAGLSAHIIEFVAKAILSVAG